MEKKTKSRSYLFGLFAVFFGPLFFAMWLFYVPNSWLNSSTQNHGTLVTPAQPLEEFELIALDGNSWRHEEFTGVWTLLYIGDESCDLYCEANLFKMRQVRLTLGRDSERVQRRYLGVTTTELNQKINEIFAKYPRMQQAWFDQATVHKAIPQFQGLPLHQVYVIDPLGNLMMWYSREATSKGMKKDLKRLLKVSKVG
jgi:cytochrome oxidase Cu insertion factor (SCO1/SenC/PrrC family)